MRVGALRNGWNAGEVAEEYMRDDLAQIVRELVLNANEVIE